MQARLQSYSQSDYAKSTSSFFSNILTTTTSKYNTLRRQLVSSEADGDTEDDSHIARALRAYYIEKGRAFPEWLPPDPNKAPPAQVTSSFVSSSGNVAAQGGGGQQPGAARWRQGGGLSDLWGDGGGRANSAGNESLRQKSPAPPGTQGSSMTTQQGRFGAVTANQQLGVPETVSRPLPSQRAGSYQTMGQQSSRFDTASPPPTSASAGSSAQERLKARLWGGGRSASPPATANSAYPPPPSSNSGGGTTTGRNPYEQMGSAPSSRNPYATSGGGGGAQQRPMVSANAPWSGSDDYGGPGGFSSAPDADYGRPQPSGLPSGPRAGRQGVGLPSGPRPQRF